MLLGLRPLGGSEARSVRRSASRRQRRWTSTSIVVRPVRCLDRGRWWPPNEDPELDEPSATTTPAIDAIAAAGVPHRVIRTVRAGSATESAELQGIPLGALLRTIVVRRGDDDYLFVLVPADRRFDWPKLRAHLAVRRLTLPDADEARAATGYERYTITPFGATRAWPVILDASATQFDHVSVGGGAFGVNLHVAPADLVAALSAVVVDVSALEERSG